jgi:hypothetical protein
VSARSALVAALVVVALAREAGAGGEVSVLGVPVARDLVEDAARRSPSDLLAHPAEAARVVASAIAREHPEAPVDEVLRRVQRLPYAAGAGGPVNGFAASLESSAPAIDCDDRSYFAAAIVNALPPEQRIATAGSAKIAVVAGAVLALPRIIHAVLLLRTPVTPSGYGGPTALLPDASLWLPVEMTVVASIGEFGRQHRAVLEDPAGDTEVDDGASVRRLRGSMRRSPAPSVVLARTRPREGR